jgi:hypothetical protein
MTAGDATVPGNGLQLALTTRKTHPSSYRADTRLCQAASVVTQPLNSKARPKPVASQDVIKRTTSIRTRWAMTVRAAMQKQASLVLITINTRRSKLTVPTRQRFAPTATAIAASSRPNPIAQVVTPIRRFTRGAMVSPAKTATRRRPLPKRVAITMWGTSHCREPMTS